MKTPQRFLSAIAAMATNRVIGDKGQIPWHIPEDFRFFKEKTMGGTLLMGRKTFESIGKPLPGRQTIVLSRKNTQFPNVRTIRSLEELNFETFQNPVWLCGGAQIYQEAMPLCKELFLTHVHKDYPGDTFFPDVEGLFDKKETILEHEEFHVTHYTR